MSYWHSAGTQATPPVRCTRPDPPSPSSPPLARQPPGLGLWPELSLAQFDRFKCEDGEVSNPSKKVNHEVSGDWRNDTTNNFRSPTYAAGVHTNSKHPGHPSGHQFLAKNYVCGMRPPSPTTHASFLLTI